VLSLQELPSLPQRCLFDESFTGVLLLEPLEQARQPVAFLHRGRSRPCGRRTGKRGGLIGAIREPTAHRTEMTLPNSFAWALESQGKPEPRNAAYRKLRRTPHGVRASKLEHLNGILRLESESAKQFLRCARRS
jgi:hypothetical protein